MKKLALFLSVAAAGLTMFAADASAQRIIVETPGARLGVGERGDRRVGYDLDRLNREVRQLRFEIRAYRGEGRRIRWRYDRVQRVTDRLNYEYQRRISSPWQIRRRIQQVRAEIYDIRNDMRDRRDRRRYDDGPRWR
ncbi:MAG TPA: hypothetical protein VK993_11135 [Chthoniobacterales bacterium]|nr:hypothetical protein [Chthoniobacterales bacterium]